MSCFPLVALGVGSLLLAPSMSRRSREIAAIAWLAYALLIAVAQITLPALTR